MKATSDSQTVEQRIRLKDARTVRVRHARDSDQELFLTFFAGLSPKSRDFMHGWSSEKACTREHAEKLAAKTLWDDYCGLVVLDRAPPRERMVAYYWFEVIGNQPDMPMLGIGVIDEYHEVGLGKTLMRLMNDQARTRGVDKLKLGVWSDNSRAIHVYESVGYRIEPAIPAKDVDGRTELYMVVETNTEKQRNQQIR